MDNKSFDCCVHTLESPTVVTGSCEGRFLAGDDAACCALAKHSGVVVLKSASDGAAATVNLASYDRVDYVFTLSVQGVRSAQDVCKQFELAALLISTQSVLQEWTQTCFLQSLMT